MLLDALGKMGEDCAKKGKTFGSREAMQTPSLMAPYARKSLGKEKAAMEAAKNHF